MTSSAGSLARLLMETVRQPREVARFIIGQGYSREVLWMGLVLVTLISVLLVAVFSVLLPPPPPEAPERIVLTPLTYATILGGSLVITVFALHYTGLMLGGEGRLEDTLALMVWLQFLLVVLQAAQVVLAIALPALGAYAAIVSVGIALWVLVHFINEAQRFESLGRAVLTLVAALLGVGVGLSTLLAVIGAGV
ncbi:Yip1 family protein [Histidinibacterium aquaticum]|uniref:YIP1 family protein n=1 Tax=Histidinibacterium aquaticum TaxID=2613962 RepID=A0A5J5GLX9_9RHOB|nr:Yip1 family protein [Histidinibacterium aquaticum]KAA9009291.1 YIP1 family protein [Histidinibacterium aquaticum]